MEVDGYRIREKKIALPKDGTIPSFPETVGQEEQQTLLAWISCLWQSVEVVSAGQQRRICCGPMPTGAEAFLGWKRWILSHHFFIPLLALVGHTLSTATKSMQAGERQMARKSLELAARMRRGCGALFMYSVDFQPCSTIYCRHIRSQMPPAFSGYEIRERQNGFKPAIEGFNAEFPKGDSDIFVKDMRSLWVEADRRYHELHERCMLQAVPVNVAEGEHKQVSHTKPESLRAAHRRQYGEAPPIAEENFKAYDNWFAIERREDVSRLDYVYQVCDVIERLLADLMVGHRLESEIVDELLDAMRAVLVVFGDWAGPVAEISPFYPKHLRGD